MSWDLDEPSPSTPPPGPAAATQEPPARASLGARLGYLLAAFLVLACLLASFNPSFGFFQQEHGFDARFWPWDVFAGPEGIQLAWLPPHAFVVGMLLGGLGLLACVFLAPGWMRASVALGSFVLVAVAAMPAPGLFMTLGGSQVALGLLLAGCIASRRAMAPTTARRLTLLAWIALALFALFPYPTQSAKARDPLAKAPYASPATEPFRNLMHALQSPTPLIERPGEAPRPMHLGDWARSNILNLTLLLALLVGLYGLVRPGSRGVSVLLAVLVLVHLIGPAVEHALRGLSEYRATFVADPDRASQETTVLLRSAAQVLLAGLRLAVLPLALGLADLVGSPRTA